MNLSIDHPGDVPYWEGHRERLRMRMEREGWDALKPHEMVELVLYHAVPRQDFSDAARALIDRFGTVGGVFAAPEDALVSVPGMSPATARWVTLTGDMMRAYYAQLSEDAVRLSHWAEVREYLRPLGPAVGNAMWMLYLDFEFNLITYAPLEARPWWAAENARQMVRHAASAGARYAILARFDDIRMPHADDGELARLRAIAVTMRAIDVEILDFVLVGRGDPVSLNRSGRMDVIRCESQNLALHEDYVNG